MNKENFNTIKDLDEQIADLGDHSYVEKDKTMLNIYLELLAIRESLVTNSEIQNSKLIHKQIAVVNESKELKRHTKGIILHEYENGIVIEDTTGDQHYLESGSFRLEDIN